MWKWSLNWDQITPSIILGTCPMACEDLARIKAGTDVSAVLSLQHDNCLAYWKIDYPKIQRTGTELGLFMERCPIRDFDIADMRKRLSDAIAILHHILSAGHKAYVHCTAGLGRSPLVTLGYLTFIENFSPDDAIKLISAARPGVVPSWEAYYGCHHDLVARYRPAIEQRAYELYQRDIHGDAEADWRLAQSEIIRAELTGRADSRS